MSLRYMCRVLNQVGMRVMQGIKDQASKCDSAALKSSIRDSTYGSSSNQARRFSGALDSNTAFKAAAKSGQLKQAEESLRTVMFLSCWGPN